MLLLDNRCSSMCHSDSFTYFKNKNIPQCYSSTIDIGRNALNARQIVFTYKVAHVRPDTHEKKKLF